jgi:hypothetical protein
MSPSSSRSESVPEPVNPYAIGSITDPNAGMLSASGPPVSRQYQARLSWEDRRSLLLSIGPTRLAATATTLVCLENVRRTFTDWHSYFAEYGVQAFADVISLAFALAGTMIACIILYVSWLNWKYADFLRDVAGGSTANMRKWSRMHYRIEWWLAFLASLHLVSRLGYSLVSKLVLG